MIRATKAGLARLHVGEVLEELQKAVVVSTSGGFAESDLWQRICLAVVLEPILGPAQPKTGIAGHQQARDQGVPVSGERYNRCRGRREYSEGNVGEGSAGQREG